IHCCYVDKASRLRVCAKTGSGTVPLEFQTPFSHRFLEPSDAAAVRCRAAFGGATRSLSHRKTGPTPTALVALRVPRHRPRGPTVLPGRLSILYRDGRLS